LRASTHYGTNLVIQVDRALTRRLCQCMEIADLHIRIPATLANKLKAAAKKKRLSLRAYLEQLLEASIGRAK